MIIANSACYEQCHTISSDSDGVNSNYYTPQIFGVSPKTDGTS